MFPLLVGLLVADGSANTIPLPPQQQRQEAPHLQCAPWDAVRSQLLERFHEKPIWSGLVDEEHAFVLFSSDHGETWTLIARVSKGVACLIESGTTGEDAPRGDGI